MFIELLLNLTIYLKTISILRKTIFIVTKKLLSYQQKITPPQEIVTKKNSQKILPDEITQCLINFY